MVKFGEFLQQRIAARGHTRMFYVDYEMLKHELDLHARSSADTIVLLGSKLDPNSTGATAQPPQVRFLCMVDREFAKVNDYVSAKLRELERAMAELVRHLQSLRSSSPDGPPPESLALLETNADALGAELTELDDFARTNRMAFVKITKKYDKMHGERASTWLSARLAKEPFCNVPLEHLLITLSDVYARIREIRARPEAAAAGVPAEAPAAWKPPAEFERSTTKYWVRPEDQMALSVLIVRHLPILIMHRPGSSASSTSSPSDLMLSEQVGASRGETAAGAITSVYLDTPSCAHYHQRIRRDEGARLYRLRWYGLSPEGSDVFVERKTHHEDWTGERSSKERFAIPAAAAAGVLSGSIDLASEVDRQVTRGELSEKDAAKALDLGAAVIGCVTKEKLSPCVRTVYQRLAFQETSNNEVRITMDSHLKLVNERLPARDQLSRRQEWCRGLGDPVELSTSGVIDFPFSVLEVKLQVAGIAWIDELLASGLLVPRPKFSKYLTGCAAFHPSQLTTLPHWFDEREIQRALRPTAAGDARERPMVSDLVPSTAGEALTAAPLSVDQVCVSASATTSALCPAERPPSPGTWSPPRGRLIGRQSPLLRRRSSSPGTKLVRPTVASPGRVRVEPKTFFANERTFIQWLSAGVLLMSIGVGLLELQASKGYSVAGLLITGLSVVIVLYGLFVYQRRIRKIQRKDAAGYDDRVGPFLLVAALITGLSIFMVVYAREVESRRIRWGAADLATPSVLRSKEFQYRLSPAAWVNRSAGLSMVVQTLSSSSRVTSVAPPTSARLFRRTMLDTADDTLLASNMSLKMLTELQGDGGASGHTPLSNGARLVLKLNSFDEDLVLVAPLSCNAQYASQCSVKVEHDLYSPWAPPTKFARSARIDALNGQTVIGSVSQVQDAFQGLISLDGPVSTMQSTDPMRVNSIDWLWRVSVPFTLVGNVPAALFVELRYSSPTAAIDAESLLQLPNNGSEVSFKVAPAEGSTMYPTGLLPAAHALLAEINAAVW